MGSTVPQKTMVTILVMHHTVGADAQCDNLKALGMSQLTRVRISGQTELKFTYPWLRIFDEAQMGLNYKTSFVITCANFITLKVIFKHNNEPWLTKKLDLKCTVDPSQRKIRVDTPIYSVLIDRNYWKFWVSHCNV